MTTGTVTRLVEDRGFGFIGSSSGKDVFFHYTQLDGIDFQALKEGQNVCYFRKSASAPKALNPRKSGLIKGNLDLYPQQLRLRG